MSSAKKTVNGRRAAAANAAGVSVKKIPVDGAVSGAVNGEKGAPTAKPAATARARAGVPVPAPKPKLVRDSFTIPKPEYAVLDALKLRAARLMRPTKKSELLRAGIKALAAMNDEAFLAGVNGVPSLKTGRPKSATPTAPAAKPASK